MGFSERIVTILNSTGRQVSESKGPLTSVVYDCSNGGFLSLSVCFATSWVRDIYRIDAGFQRPCLKGGVRV